MYRIFYLTLLTLFMLTTTTASAGVVYSKSICDQVIDNIYYTICYDYAKHGALYVSYTLDGKLVNKGGRKRHLGFHSERKLPKVYRVMPYNYSTVSSIVDKGHLAPDAAFDYDKKVLRTVYSMANIIPQYSVINRYTWVKAEAYARSEAVRLGKVNVLNGVVYPKHNYSIYRMNIVMPLAYWKMIYTKNTKVCFWYDNIPNVITTKDTLEKHRIPCNKLALHGLTITTP